MSYIGSSYYYLLKSPKMAEIQTKHRSVLTNTPLEPRLEGKSNTPPGGGTLRGTLLYDVNQDGRSRKRQRIIWNDFDFGKQLSLQNRTT